WFQAKECATASSCDKRNFRKRPGTDGHQQPGLQTMSRWEKPKIGLYQPYPHTFGGLQAIVLKLAKNLPAFGYEPIILCPEEGKFTQALRSENLPYMIFDPGSRWHVYGRGDNGLSYFLSLRRVLELVRYWRRLSRGLRNSGIALLHCNDYRGVML